MKRVGRYAILGLLGRGGMGAVFKAAMPHTGRLVALKLLKPSEMLAATADQRALRLDFLREAALMARIRHPGVAQVLDVDEDAGGRPFFVMEYFCNNLGALLGESYRVEQPTRRLGVEQALGLARQLASALARLHFEGVLHRDVKPYNLMLAEGEAAEGDTVKLIDFGLSRLRGELPGEGMELGVAGRPRGVVVGSPCYAAPEQEADPAAADERADIFSAGVTLFRCLTGRLPQEGIAPSALRQGLDRRFDDFLARVCHEKPSARPDSARALLAELDELARHWERLRQAACALPDEAPPWPAPAIGSGGSVCSGGPCGPVCSGGPCGPRPRSTPVRQPLAGARQSFGLDDLWRPQAHDPNRFEALPGSAAPEAALVRDRRTALLWQRGGTPYPVTLAGARAYAQRLNSQSHCGRTGWRLPTAEELATLLIPEPDLRRLCVGACFEPMQRRLWSADRKSFTSAWYADAEHGFLWWQDQTCEFHARCVCAEDGGQDDGGQDDGGQDDGGQDDGGEGGQGPRG